MGSYSSHLDWHFRARRRERDNARKAQSRLVNIYKLLVSLGCSFSLGSSLMNETICNFYVLTYHLFI